MTHILRAGAIALLTSICLGELQPSTRPADVARDAFDELTRTGGINTATLARCEFTQRVLDDTARERVDPGVSLGVLVDPAGYESGAAVPVLLVLANHTGAPRSLDMGIDNLDSPQTLYNSIDIRLTDAKGAQQHISNSVWSCGGPGLATVAPRDGEAPGPWCAQFDLADAQVALAPGAYTLSWSYAGRHSPDVPLVIRKPVKRTTQSEPKRGFVLELNEMVARDEAAKVDPDAPIRMDFSGPGSAERVDPEKFTDWLAGGFEERCYPSVHRLRDDDGVLRAAFELAPGDAPTRGVVTLTSRRRLTLEVPALLLFVETSGAASADVDREQFAKPALAHQPFVEIEPDHPLRIEFTLPKDWRSQVPHAGKAKLSVLVSSRHYVERAGEAGVITKRLESVRTAWNGILRTNAAEIEFPEHRAAQLKP